MSPHFNERDIEIPQLLNFVDEHSKQITTILDVGCYGSIYLKELKERGKIVDGIDLTAGEKEKEFLQNYFVGNAITYPLGHYDLVICLSTLEHAGLMEQHRVDDFVQEQLLLFKKVVDSSKRFIYATFPYGAPSVCEKQLVNITRNCLDEFLKVIPKTACKMRFYLNEEPSAGLDWTECSQDDADKIEWNRFKGCRCLCVLEVIL